MHPNASEYFPSLLDVAEIPAVPGLTVPSQFYTIALKPVPIAGMEYPSSSTPWSALDRLGFCHIICLTELRPAYSPSPLRIAHAIDLEDLLGRERPSDPAREERLIAKAVEVALDKIRAKEGIIIHCMGGTGRTGTVIGCLLRALGCEGPDVVKYLDRLNKARGRHGWPESPWQGDLVLRFQI
jgi:hypothetical protein